MTWAPKLKNTSDPYYGRSRGTINQMKDIWWTLPLRKHVLRLNKSEEICLGMGRKSNKAGKIMANSKNPAVFNVQKITPEK